MKKAALLLMVVLVFAASGTIIQAEEAMDMDAVIAALKAAAASVPDAPNDESFVGDGSASLEEVMATMRTVATPPPVVPNNTPIIIGHMDPNAIYEPGLVVYDSKSKHIVIVNSLGEPEEFKGVIQNGEVIQYANTGQRIMRCPINAKRKLHGTAKHFNLDGFQYGTVEYKDGLMDGARAVFFSDGKLSSSETYSKGVLNGTQTIYHANGQLMMQGNFKNGIYDGKHCRYEKTGKLISQVVYVNGVPQKDGYYHANNREDSDEAMENFVKLMNSPELQKAAQADYDAWDGNKILKVVPRERR